VRKTRYRHNRSRFLRNVRKRPLKRITILPSLITILNGVCGFGAIVFASSSTPAEHGPDHIAVSAYLVFIAMIADMLDGRLARMSQSTSSFGGQLDSLCDVISFGVAPAFIMFRVLTNELAQTGLISENLIMRFIWLCALAYVCSTVIRLARFNVENVPGKSDHSNFIGLPSPAAAGVVCSLALFYRENLPNFTPLLVALPLTTLGVAILMVSRINYTHVPNHYLTGRKPFSYLIKILLLLGALIVNRQATLLIVFCGFALSGLIRAGYRRLVHKSARDTASADAQAREELPAH